MADETISQLSVYSTYHSDDEWEVLDVHDTTMAPAGTNKRVTFASFIALANMVTVGGASIAQSQVTGLTTDLAAKATDSLVVHLAGTETIAGAKTFSFVPTWPAQSANRIFAGPTTGVPAAPAFRALVGADLPNPSATTVGGIQSYAAVASQWINAISTSGVPSSTQPAFSDLSGTVATAQLGAAQVTYPKIQNVAAFSFLGNPTSSPAAPSEVTLGPNLAFVGSTVRARVPIATVLSPATAVANSVALTSIFSGSTLGGSLTIPANTLQAGSLLTLNLFGAFSSVASSNFFIKITLGGTLIAQGLPSQTMSAGTVTNFSWCFQYANLCGFLIQATGATGKITGGTTFSPQGGTAQVLTAAGTTGAPASQVTINTTASLALDVLVQWGTASASDSFQLLGGAIYLDY